MGMSGGVLQTPPPIYGTWDTTGYGQRAGGTHPTGMHSCLKDVQYCEVTVLRVCCIKLKRKLIG